MNNNYLNFSKYYFTKTNFDLKEEKKKSNSYDLISKYQLTNIM